MSRSESGPDAVFALSDLSHWHHHAFSDPENQRRRIPRWTLLSWSIWRSTGSMSRLGSFQYCRFHQAIPRIRRLLRSVLPR